MCGVVRLGARVRPLRTRPPSRAGWLPALAGAFTNIFSRPIPRRLGLPRSELQADWAAQRIKNLNLFNAVKNALFPKKGQREITTLIDQFEYPQLGPGMMWERCCDKVEAAGSKVMMPRL